jgi:acyl-CoA thioester hydrolase
MLVKDATIRVRYAETDQMGVVYHTNYIVWFEIGRTEWFRQINQDYKALEDQNIILPVIEVNCKYKKPALYDDNIIVRTYLKEIKGIRLIFHYEILRMEDEELLAEGETTHAFVDKDKNPVRLKKKFPELWHILNKFTE